MNSVVDFIFRKFSPQEKGCIQKSQMDILNVNFFASTHFKDLFDFGFTVHASPEDDVKFPEQQLLRRLFINSYLTN